MNHVSKLVRLDVIGTALFLAVLAVAIPLRDRRPAQFTIGGVSMVLFAIGVAAALWGYTSALERSRTDEVGVANLFLLTGPTAPSATRRPLTASLVLQVLGGLGGAIAGVVGLDEGKLNALAFGVLVPMFGIGINGLWAARYGSFGPRVASSSAPSNRPIE